MNALDFPAYKCGYLQRPFAAPQLVRLFVHHHWEGFLVGLACSSTLGFNTAKYGAAPSDFDGA